MGKLQENSFVKFSRRFNTAIFAINKVCSLSNERNAATGLEL